jgi:hypothetical protein
MFRTDEYEEDKKKILLFTNYGPMRGMNIHIYNYIIIQNITYV